MPVVPVFPDSTGGGATAYDVSPPAATSDAVASGGSLSAKTFGSFTGTDAGLITTYARRVVNASGTTTWSDGGTDDTLGPWTASGAADGSAGVLALDAYIGSVVVATALHDYAIASASGGGSGPAAEAVGELDLTSNMTAGSKTTTGAFTIYEADGTTVKATGEVTTSGTLDPTWTVEWDTSYGIRIVNVTKGGGASGTVVIALNAPSATFSTVDWSKDDIVMQAVYGASAVPTDGAIWYGAAPYGSTALAVNDGRNFKVTVASSTASWTTERWGNYDSATVTSLGASTVPSGAVYFQEARYLGTRIKLGASDYIDPALWESTTWDGRGIGRMLIAVDDDYATERYNAAGGYTCILAVNSNSTLNDSSTTFQKARWYRRLATGSAVTRLLDLDFTTNITDLNLTVGGGDTTLYESDGTTVKATVGAFNRVGSPATSTAAITAALGGAGVSNAGTNTSTDLYTRITAASIGADFSDPSKVYMVSCKVSGITFAQINDTLGAWISPAANFGTTNGSWGGQHYQSGASLFASRAIRYLASSFGVGADLATSATAKADIVVTCVLYRGRLADVFITEGTTVPSTYPTVGGSVYLEEGGGDAVSIGGSWPLYSTDLYVIGEQYSGGASTGSSVIERITIDEWSL